MKTPRYHRTAIYVFVLVGILWGCSSRIDKAGAVSARSRYPAAIERAKRDKRYMMLHSGINLYSIASVEMDKAKQQLTVQLDKADSLHLMVNGSEVSHGKSKLAQPPEMHLYMTDSVSYTLDEPHTILLDKVARIEWVE